MAGARAQARPASLGYPALELLRRMTSMAAAFASIAGPHPGNIGVPMGLPMGLPSGLRSGLPSGLPSGLGVGVLSGAAHLPAATAAAHRPAAATAGGRVRAFCVSRILAP
mmetsp:Transcript_4803/g.9962  ORF Transcript_4803/g.9962 Transcript_4803/m.9962 type:complete len:110 (+) Transcript_4803:179-508(+)